MRVLSGIQPTGHVHLGNYLGAIRGWVEDQHHHDSFFTVVDLHAITQDQDPAELSGAILELYATLLGAGLDPAVSTIFVQSQLNEHPALAWLLECTATYGELHRMTQFKDKGKGSESVRAGLFTYPVLMAADILLYQADRVPVGEDQKQHLELTRDLAIRFNHRFGETFVIPQPAIPKVAARVMDLQSPERKMSKSQATPLGILYVLDEPTEIKKKISRAVTDTETHAAYDPQKRPGVSNLLEIFSAVSGVSPTELAERYSSYGALKADLTAALVAELEPVRLRTEEYLADRAELVRIMSQGAEKARLVAGATLKRAKEAMGFIVG